MTTLAGEVHHADVAPRVHKLKCSVRTAVFQAGLVIGAGVADRCDSGGRRAYRDSGLARHGAVAREAVSEVSPGIEPGQMVHSGGESAPLACVDRRVRAQRSVTDDIGRHH